MGQSKSAHAVVTIDGPSSSGKSTVARNIATRLRFIHLNSGALFRAVGVLAARQGLNLSGDDELADFARRLSFRFLLNGDGTTTFTVDGADLVADLNTREAGELASVIAVLPKVRDVLTNVQREVATQGSVVVEGRDVGTVVFPNARWKFYLDAPAEVRAARRLAELVSRGEKSFSGATEAERLAEITADFVKRDLRDKTRNVAPLKVAEGAEVIDTGGRTIDEIVSLIAEKVGSANRAE